MNDVNIFHLANIRLPIEKNRLLMLFVGVNLLFTGIDVVLAHSINSYIPVYEWIPIIYFPLGSISCFLIALKTKPQKWQALVHIALMITGVLIGVIGTAFHANAVLNPAGYLTWSWVVFGSPILAPLAFSGISLLGLYAVTEEVENQPGLLNVPGLGTFKAPISRDRHFLWLVGLGFGASAITSIIDHAQYGYSFYKLIAIVFGVFATSVVLYLSVAKEWTKGDGLVYFWTMIAAIITGVLGFGFHLSADLAGTGAISLERILAFAPVLAPLLFADLGMLGLLVVAQQKK
ncbi:MAG: hypothetical protein P4L45_12050 [Ignavibacteriaceae bacterium]|nr:hypothetical protein [Ignavibacteriaceae bacterium]